MKNLLLLAVFLITLAACQNTENSEQKTTQQTKSAVKTVKVKTFTLDTIPVIAKHTATINAYDKVFLAPTIPGRIKSIDVEVNDKVRTGQKIIQMDDTQLIQMQIQFNNLEKEMHRMDTLIAYESVSQQLYDQTKSQYDAMKENLENMKENTIMSSPFSGVVTGRFYDENEIYLGSPNTQEGKPAIVTIEQINKLKVKISVSERYFPMFKNDLEATLISDIYPNRTFAGKVSLIYPTINPTTRTFTTEITIPNNDLALRPGMFSRVEVKLNEKVAITAPSSTILTLSGTSEKYVYIIRNNVAQMVKIEIGERFDDFFEIISDEIRVGDQLVVAGQTKLDNGDKVSIVL